MVEIKYRKAYSHHVSIDYSDLSEKTGEAFSLGLNRLLNYNPSLERLNSPRLSGKKVPYFSLKIDEECIEIDELARLILKIGDEAGVSVDLVHFDGIQLKENKEKRIFSKVILDYSLKKNKYRIKIGISEKYRYIQIHLMDFNLLGFNASKETRLRLSETEKCFKDNLIGGLTEGEKLFFKEKDCLMDEISKIFTKHQVKELLKQGMYSLSLPPFKLITFKFEGIKIDIPRILEEVINSASNFGVKNTDVSVKRLHVSKSNSKDFPEINSICFEGGLFETAVQDILDIYGSEEE